MFKIYEIQTFTGEYRVIAINEWFAKRKAYKKYKKTRNTTFRKFDSNIMRISVLK